MTNCQEKFDFDHLFINFKRRCFVSTVLLIYKYKMLQTRITYHETLNNFSLCNQFLRHRRNYAATFFFLFFIVYNRYISDSFSSEFYLMWQLANHIVNSTMPRIILYEAIKNVIVADFYVWYSSDLSIKSFAIVSLRTLRWLAFTLTWELSCTTGLVSGVHEGWKSVSYIHYRFHAHIDDFHHVTNLFWREFYNKRISSFCFPHYVGQTKYILLPTISKLGRLSKSKLFLSL